MGVSSETRNGVSHIEISSRNGNTLTRDILEQLSKAVARDAARKDIRAAVISGRGKHFSSGASIPQLRDIFTCSNSEDIESFQKTNSEMLSLIEESDMVFTAAVNGCCLGLGLEIALACDFIIAGKNSVFSFPETGYSLIPGCGGSIRLRERTGREFSVDMILSSRMVSAQEGFEAGLVDHICTKRELASRAESISKYKN